MLVCEVFLPMAYGQRFEGCGPSLGFQRCTGSTDSRDVNEAFSRRDGRSSQVLLLVSWFSNWYLAYPTTRWKSIHWARQQQSSGKVHG